MSPSLDDLDVAVAHWHVRAWGGAEYLVTHLADTLDVDRVHTIGEPEPDDPNPYGDIEWVNVIDDLSPRPIRRLQASVGRVFEYALWEDVDWRDYGAPDVLVTSGSTTRAVLTPDDALHVNYCHSPPRWFYDLYHDRKDTPVGIFARPLVRHLRTRDTAVDSRVDEYLANSPVIARRIWKYYKREADVLYPPVDIDTYRDDGDQGYYLHLGRLDSEKGVHEVVEAFAGTDNELVLAGGPGDASEDVRARIRHAPNIGYRGFVDEKEKIELLAGCRALIFNARNEDFGIVPIEALASGKAVLARNEGFPSRVVEDEVTGYLHDGTPGGIRTAIDTFLREGVSGAPRERARLFSRDACQEQFTKTLMDAYDEFDARF